MVLLMETEVAALATIEELLLILVVAVVSTAANTSTSCARSVDITAKPSALLTYMFRHDYRASYVR